MVAPIYTAAFTAVILLVMTVVTIAAVWASLREEEHTPAALQSEGSG